MALALGIDSGERCDAKAKTVLVVEDNPDLNDLIKLVLAAEGYQVTGALDGSTALGLARMMKPSLITLDLDLPKLDGQSVLDQLQADAGTRQIPVIVVSGRTATLRRTRQVKSVMAKPFDVDDLLGAIDRAICAA